MGLLFPLLDNVNGAKMSPPVDISFLPMAEAAGVAMSAFLFKLFLI